MLPLVEASVQDRCRGALLGLAVGDALGTTLEFQNPGTFQPIAHMSDGGPWNLQPGQWTDDTSMALCLAESLIQRGEFDPKDQMERYVRWYRHGHLSSTGHCFDIGITTARALQRFEQTGEPYAGSSDPYSAGNGSIMRLAPIPILCYGRKEYHEAIDRAGDSSCTTHGAAACIDACRYLAALILGALMGISKEDLLSSGFYPRFCSRYMAGAYLSASHREHFLTDEISSVALGSFKRRNPPEIRGTGYVVQSLEAALWAFHHGKTFREGCLLAVNLGDDADTTGAVYGQLAGAYYGAQGIPAEWRSRVAMGDPIADLADRLLAQSPYIGKEHQMPAYVSPTSTTNTSDRPL